MDRPTQASRRPLGAGDAGTVTTIAEIRRMIWDWSAVPEVREAAELVTSGAEAHNSYEQAELLFRWLRTAAKYCRDPVEHELLRTPDYVFAQVRAGRVPQLDCDDYVLLGGSLLASLGIPVRAHKVAFEAGAPYQHVYLAAHVSRGFDAPLQWVALDPTSPGAVFGDAVAEGLAAREAIIPLSPAPRASRRLLAVGLGFGLLVILMMVRR